MNEILKAFQNYSSSEPKMMVYALCSIHLQKQILTVWRLLKACGLYFDIQTG